MKDASAIRTWKINRRWKVYRRPPILSCVNTTQHHVALPWFDFAQWVSRPCDNIANQKVTLIGILMSIRCHKACPLILLRPVCFSSVYTAFTYLNAYKRRQIYSLYAHGKGIIHFESLNLHLRSELSPKDLYRRPTSKSDWLIDVHLFWQTDHLVGHWRRLNKS